MKGGGACMVDSFERWRELGQRLQLFLQGAILGGRLRSLCMSYRFYMLHEIIT